VGDEHLKRGLAEEHQRAKSQMLHDGLKTDEEKGNGSEVHHAQRTEMPLIEEQGVRLEVEAVNFALADGQQ